MWQTCRKYTPTNFKALQRKAAARHIQNSALSWLSLSSKKWNSSELTKKHLWAYDCPIFRLVVSNQKEEPHKSEGTPQLQLTQNDPKLLHPCDSTQAPASDRNSRQQQENESHSSPRAYWQPLAYRWRMTLSTSQTTSIANRSIDPRMLLWRQWRGHSPLSGSWQGCRFPRIPGRCNHLCQAMPGLWWSFWSYFFLTVLLTTQSCSCNSSFLVNCRCAKKLQVGRKGKHLLQRLENLCASCGCHFVHNSAPNALRL